MEGKENTDFQLKNLLELINKLKANASAGTSSPEDPAVTECIVKAFESLISENQALKQFHKYNEVRINNIVDIMLQYHKSGVAPRANISMEKDEVDAIATGLNILVEELESSNQAEKSYLSKLEKSEKRYKQLIESIKDYGIYMIDSNGLIISWNKGAEKTKGYSSEEVIGKNYAIFFNQEDINNGLPEHNLAMAIKHGHYENDTWRKKKDGSQFWANIILTPLHDENGNLYGFSKITRDITERKKAEEKISQLNNVLEENIRQLEEVNKELESFSYSVSHDLRAPLRAIHGYTNILFEDFFPNPDPEALRLMGLITYNAERMGRLVDDLLAFSQLGRKSIKIRNVNINSLIDLILQDLKNSERQLVCEFKVHPMLNAQADYSLIEQVFRNLISNAIKYSGLKDNPMVEIGSSQTGDKVTYYVKDNGVGFDMKYYHKLFGVFQRLHKSREFEGTGVGLALVQRIILKHGGSVWADAIPGEGATFYFSI